MSGRYELFGPVAAGGMATVHFGRVRGGAGFQRIVAIKRLHRELAEVPEIAASLVDEARLVSRIRHKNVVPILDVVEEEGELWLVMEYVAGESLAGVLAGAGRAHERLPPAVASAIVGDALEGLHAAHTAVSELGEPLGIVHRDVSPQNVLVGADGVARLLDFGVAKARSRLGTTRAGQVKGKLGYMAPEQILGGDVGPAADVFSAAVVLWEALVGARLFAADNEGQVVLQVLQAPIVAPGQSGAASTAELDAVVMRGLARDPAQRFRTARELGAALATVAPPAPPALVAAWVQRAAGARIADRAAKVAAIDRAAGTPAAHPSSRASARPAPVYASPDEMTRDDRAPPVVASATTPTARRSRWPLALTFALALVAGATAAVTLLRPAPAPVATPSVSAAPVAAASPSTAETTPAPSSSASSPPSSEAAPAAAPAASARSTAPSPRPRGTARQPQAHAPSANCNPPFSIDADGIQHLKPECAK